MSFDLAFFAFHKGKTSLEQIETLYNKALSGEKIEWSTNEDFEKFKTELFSAHPPPDVESEDNPSWSCDVVQGVGYFFVSISSNIEGNSALELIDSLIKKYDFVTVDPQAPPPDYISVG